MIAAVAKQGIPVEERVTRIEVSVTQLETDVARDDARYEDFGRSGDRDDTVRVAVDNLRRRIDLIDTSLRASLAAATLWGVCIAVALLAILAREFHLI